ncbi:MAG: AAA family ATPase, partial [Clostridia bacterium]|nr:AAA family ATPase [Clostridia bacterium]
MICSKCKQRPAVIFITKMEGDKTTNEGLCIKCAMEMNIGPIKQMMDNMGITEDQLDDMTEQMEQMMETMGEDAFQPGGASTFPFLQNMGLMPTDVPEENIKDLNGDKNNASEGKKKQGTKNDKRKMLSLYCTDLTGRARDGKLDRIIGRDTEIARAVQILCRRTKNNPCLIGEPGVGKTAIAEGIAISIAEGNDPAKLMDKELHLIDLTALVAGTQFRGQFESRIKGLVEEVKSEGNIILFIDEVHNLVGTGDAEGSMNAANILKPALYRGEIQVIGA